MEEKIDNLMVPTVNQILEEVLGGYPDYPYKKALTHPDIRRNLLTQVLSQLSNWHPIEEEDKSDKNTADHAGNFQISVEDKIYIQNLIRQEIAYIVQQKAECTSRKSSEDVDSCLTPSHWFG